MGHALQVPAEPGLGRVRHEAHAQGGIPQAADRAAPGLHGVLFAVPRIDDGSAVPRARASIRGALVLAKGAAAKTMAAPMRAVVRHGLLGLHALRHGFQLGC